MSKVKIRPCRPPHLRNSRFSFKLNPIRFYAAHRRVFVYLAVSGFEVLSKRYRRRQRGRDCQHCVPRLQFAWQETRSPPPKNYPLRNCQYCERVGCAYECRDHFTCLPSFQRRTSASSSKTSSAFQPCATVMRLTSPQTDESPVPLPKTQSAFHARSQTELVSGLSCRSSLRRRIARLPSRSLGEGWSLPITS